MKILKLFFSLFIILICTSCSQESLSGCTNCNAVNFNENATEEDSTCIFINSERLGEYAVKDSTMDWSLTWWYYEYHITIDRDSCNYEGIKINNVGNMNNGLKIIGKVNGDSLIIPSQFSSGYEIFETNGYFIEDSFFVQIQYLTPNFGDAYLKNLRGKKIINFLE